MEYFLCNSSSEEEGEIKATKLRLDERSIYARSFYDKHYFVGPNKSVLPVRRFFSEKKPEYLKKKLKKISYFANLFTFLNQFKVPSNDFVLKKELKIQKENFVCQNENPEPKIKSLKLIFSTELKKMTNLKEIKHFSKFKNTYLQDMSDVLLNSDHKGTTIILTDRILNNLKKFRTPFKVMKFNNRNIVVFLDPFILKEDFKTLFKFYGKECLAQTLDFTEVRKYLCDDTEIVVFSYNSFESEGKNCRVYFNFDEPKNLNVFVEEEGIKLIEDYEEIDDELSILLGIDFFEEGDYFFEDYSFFMSEGLPGENDFDFNYESLFQ